MSEFSFSYWEQNTFLNHYDVIIVGSGIVGLNTALNLKQNQPQLKVAVLERGILPSGASTKNAGFACFGSVSELLSDIKKYGEETVFNLVKKRLKGLATLRNNVGDDALSFQKKGGYELFKTEDEMAMEEAFNGIAKLNKLLQPILKTPDIFAVNNAKIAEFGFSNAKGLIENFHEGQLDTGKMMQSLLRKVQELGVMIFNQSEVLSFAEGSKIYIETTSGNFTSKKVVFATNAFTTKLLPQIEVKPARGQVLVTEKIPNLKLSGTFHYDKGFYYFRDIDGRVLLGGGRNLDLKGEETFALETSEEIQKALEKLLADVILPQQKVKIDYRWSGIMGFGDQLEPIIKKLRENVYVAARCNGMGVAIGSLTGMEMADLVMKDL